MEGGDVEGCGSRAGRANGMGRVERASADGARDGRSLVGDTPKSWGAVEGEADGVSERKSPRGNPDQRGEREATAEQG